MSIFRPTYHSPIYEPVTYFEKNGKQMAKFRLLKSGKLVTGEVINGKAKIASPQWYARLRKNGKVVRVPLHVEDKAAAEQLAAQLQKRNEHQRAGLIDPLAEHRGIPLSDHLLDYRSHMEASGFSKEHVIGSIRRVERVLQACSFKYIEEFRTPPMNRYLTGLIKDGMSYRSRNRALITVNAFIHWMQKNERMETEPFRSINMLSEQTDPKRRVRRALTSEEVVALILAAEKGQPVQCVEGPERAILYALAVTSGLRATECAKLQIRDLNLTAEIPYLVLPAIIAKAKREDVIPLHPIVAGKLADFINGRNLNAYVFNLISEGGVRRQVYLMMKTDCEAAGIPTKNEYGHADFHALRTTYITNVCRLTDQFTAMKLARHTTPSITAKHYDKVQLDGKAKTVLQLTLALPKQT